MYHKALQETYTLNPNLVYKAHDVPLNRMSNTENRNKLILVLKMSYNKSAGNFCTVW